MIELRFGILGYLYLKSQISSLINVELISYKKDDLYFW